MAFLVLYTNVHVHKNNGQASQRVNFFSDIVFFGEPLPERFFQCAQQVKFCPDRI